MGVVDDVSEARSCDFDSGVEGDFGRGDFLGGGFEGGCDEFSRNFVFESDVEFLVGVVVDDFDGLVASCSFEEFEEVADAEA